MSGEKGGKVAAVDAPTTAPGPSAPPPTMPCPAIIPVGFESFMFLPEQGPMRQFPAAGIDLDALTVAVELGIEERSAAVAIYPSWQSGETLKALQRVRYATSSRRLLLYGTDLPPLAGSVLASMASAVPSNMATPGVLHAALPVLEREIYHCAWLSSVAGLSHPSPSLRLHARSILPGSAFAVHSWPEPRVKLITAKDRGVPVPRTDRPMRLALAPRDADTLWPEEVVAPGFGSPPISNLPPTALGPTYWGTKKLVEVVVYPVDVSVTARLMTRSLQPRSCRWCGETIASTPCPFCGGAADDAVVGGDL